jgi:Methyltransferase domain
MLEKTFLLLKGIKPGTYVPPDGSCYDDAEINELGNALRRLLYSPSQLRRRLQELGVTIVPADYYSQIPTIKDIEEQPSGFLFSAGFDLPYQSGVLAALMPYSEEFDPPTEQTSDTQFAWTGGMFSFSDAMAYYCFVRYLRPTTIIEVGCGSSTLIADAALRANGSGRIICIEPYPRDYLSKVATATVVQRPVQEVPPEFFNQQLTDGDLVFIDSTHTVKHGSDCLHLYLSVLPEIEHDISIHVHDVFLPFPTPLHWLRDLQVYWTEQYLLYAYLMDNPRTKIMYGSNYHHHYNRGQLKAFMHGRYAEGGGSLWFSQRRRGNGKTSPAADAPRRPIR